MKSSVGVGGVQNRHSGCYRRMPFLAPNKGGVRQGAEQLILRLQRGRRSITFEPDKNMPLINRGMVYLGACLIAGIRLRIVRENDEGWNLLCHPARP